MTETKEVNSQDSQDTSAVALKPAKKVVMKLGEDGRWGIDIKTGESPLTQREMNRGLRALHVHFAQYKRGLTLQSRKKV